MKVTTFCRRFLSDDAEIYLFRDGLPKYCGRLGNCPFEYLKNANVVNIEWLYEYDTMRICVESDN